MAVLWLPANSASKRISGWISPEPSAASGGDEAEPPRLVVDVSEFNHARSLPLQNFMCYQISCWLQGWFQVVVVVPWWLPDFRERGVGKPEIQKIFVT
ncbi:hypothetical protein L1987_64748 [Smallanthus sonchifolius]|uniref:Uncharacterized protein n=1 Tax=Smallanthus sonchifolius TaxID=185202 RepID=A0ACB9BSL1_9ASTR|nr:hypothetical protein L1987_64748 [Smallanthus sonchifolius]